MASFAKDVAPTIKVPAVQAPDPSRNTSTLQDVASIASFALQVKNRNDATEHNVRAAAKKEKLAGVALGIDRIEQEMVGQEGVTSAKTNVVINNFIKSHGLSAVDQLFVLGEAAKSGDLRDTLAKEEANARVAVKEFNNSAAQRLVGDATMDDGNRAIVEQGLQLEAEQKVKTAKINLELKELSLDTSQTNNTELKATKTAAILIGEIQTNAQIGINKVFHQYDTRTKLPQGDPNFLSLEDARTQKIVELQQASDLFANTLTSSMTSLEPLVASKVSDKMQAIIQSFNVQLDLVKGSIANTTFANTSELVLQNTMKREEADLLMGNSTIRKVVIATNLGLIADGNTMKLAGSTLSSINVLSDVSGAVLDFVTGPTPPPSDKEHKNGKDWVGKFFDLFEGSDEDAEKVVKEIAREKRSVMDQVTKGEVPDEDGAVKEWTTTDTVEHMKNAVTSPTKFQFNKESVGGVIDTVQKHWKTLTPEQQASISGQIGDYTTSFIGTTSQGAFIPSINASYGKLFDISGKPLYTIGLHPQTGGLKIVLASDAEIEKQLSNPQQSLDVVTGFGSVRPLDQRLRLKKRELIKWAKSVENSPEFNGLMNSVVKATGVKKEDAMKFVLQHMNGEGLPVDQSIFPPPEPIEELQEFTDAPKFGVIGDTKSNAQEIVDKILNADEDTALAFVKELQDGGTQPAPKGQLFKDEEGTTWEQLPDGSFKKVSG